MQEEREIFKLIYKKELSYPNFCSFGNSFDNFFKKYEISEDAEIYFFYAEDSENNNSKSTDLKHLKKIKYKSSLVIWFSVDSIIGSKESYNYYKDSSDYFLKELKEICSLHKDKKFILFISNQGRYINYKETPLNLYISTIINVKFDEKYLEPFQKKNDNNTKWITLNSEPKAHRIALIFYLFSLDLQKKGFISYSNYIKEEIKRNPILKIKKYYMFEDDLLKNFKQQTNKILSKKPIIKSYGFYQKKYENQKTININNFNNNLRKIYSNFFLEIVTCTFFHEPFPLISEKEAHAFLAKNLPIFIGSQGTVKYIRENWKMDLFDDLINHSYDEIKDPTVRLIKAIDNNIHLLNGKVDLKKEWTFREKRINDNYFKMIEIMYNTEVQNNIDFVFIKESLDHFKISYKEKN